MRIKHTNTPAVENETDALERDAFNAAFRELGLRWHWDAPTFQALKSIGGDDERIHAYMESHCPHLLKVYDAAFLANAVQGVKSERLDTYAGRRSRASAECADFALAQTGF